jgi:hypothetical protein
MAKRVSHVVQFVGIVNAEIGGPSGLIFHEDDFNLGHVLTFMHVL